MTNRRKDSRSLDDAGSFMVKYFSIISIPVIVIVGLLISYFITVQTEDIMFKSYADVTASNVKSFINAELKADDFDQPMTGARYTRFRSFLNDYVLSEDILKIKLWNKKGQVIYSDDQRLIGKTFPIKEDLAEALEGEANSEIVDTKDADENKLDKGQFEQAVETYVPVAPKGSKEVVGSYEVYLSLKPVISAVNRVRLLVFSGLLALYVLLVLIVRWASAMLISQYKKLMEFSNLMRSKAITDELTGLFNRRYFDQKLADEFRRALRYGRPLSIILLDIDHFKSVNDELGHQVGDQILEKTGALINANLRNVDYAARYGGEEFALIMPETEGQNALIVAERLRKAYTSILKEYRSDELPLTISLGVAEYPSSASTSDDLIAHSDVALYYSKNKGRNQSNYYNQMPASAKKENKPKIVGL